ncbi:DUF2807 domain-containing protein [Flavobacteriaceae bacterium D16]|nr:DUF2807 domain-containing protein [Flavobacteriaceae bacterium D16]
MKTKILFFCIVLISSPLAAQKKPKIAGNKQVRMLSKEIPNDFNAVEVNDDLEINLQQGSSNHYRLNADSNLHTVVQFIVTDSILKIFTTDHITSSKKLEINLTVKQLEHLIVKHGSSVKTEGQLNSDKFYLSGYNSGRVDLDISAEDVTVALHRNAGGSLRIKSENTMLIMNDRTDLKAEVLADKVRVTLNNTADLDLNGDAEYAVFNLKKASTLNARKMNVQSADLYTSNTSDVYVNASRNLEVYAQGKSNVYVYGNPNLEIKGLTEKSKIIKK